MLAFLPEYSAHFSPLNVFRYITFRTGGATATALLFVFWFGPAIISLRRLRQGMNRGVVHAKTGTLDRVATLTGYLGRDDGVLVVSLMYNGRRIGHARAAEWELFRLLGAEGVALGGVLETHMGGTSTIRDE